MGETKLKWRESVEGAPQREGKRRRGIHGPQQSGTSFTTKAAAVRRTVLNHVHPTNHCRHLQRTLSSPPLRFALSPKSIHDEISFSTLLTHCNGRKPRQFSHIRPFRTRLTASAHFQTHPSPSRGMRHGVRMPSTAPHGAPARCQERDRTLMAMSSLVRRADPRIRGSSHGRRPSGSVASMPVVRVLG